MNVTNDVKCVNVLLTKMKAQYLALPRQSLGVLQRNLGSVTSKQGLPLSHGNTVLKYFMMVFECGT